MIETSGRAAFIRVCSPSRTRQRFSSTWQTRRRSFGREPKRSSDNPARRRPSGLSPGPAAKHSRAISSTIRRPSPAGACSTSPPARPRRHCRGAGGRSRDGGRRYRRFRDRSHHPQRCRERCRDHAPLRRSGRRRRRLGRRPRRRHLLRARYRGAGHWLAFALARRGATVLIGDPGRSYLPKDRLERLAEYEVPVTRGLEDAEVKRSSVWRFRTPSPACGRGLG